jgi:uncharacterized spore protein YtfJ
MDVQELLGTARDALTVRRVYGDPYERDGVTVIPAASVRGGGGGGGGESTSPDGGAAGSGQGGGFGLSARPVGAFVLKEGTVTWQPAFDVSRVVLGGQIVAIVALLAVRGIVKARAKSRRRTGR